MPGPHLVSRSTAVLLSACLGLALAAYSDAPRAQTRTVGAHRPVPVVWVIGQSNAHGAASGYWLSNPVGPGARYTRLSAPTGVRTWWPGTTQRRPTSAPGWEPYRTGCIAMVNNASVWITEERFGPEASLGDAVKNRFGEAWIYKFTWVARLDPRAVPSFSRGATATDGLYGVMFQNWLHAVAHLHAQGLEPDIKAICWVQGEGDTRATGHPDLLLYARAYEANLNQFIADLRSDLGPTRRPIPFVISQLHDQHVPREVWGPGETLVRAAQANVAAADPFTVLCPIDGISIENDQGMIHFDEQGLVDLGYRMFQTLAPLLQ